MCWERPMQSSFMNAEKLRLTAANHSAGPSFSDELGTCPALGSRSVAVDNAEAAELGLRLALPPAPEHQSGGGADAARKEEANSERPDRNRRQIGAQFGADVGCLADLLAKRLRCTGELLPFGLDVPADLVERTAVATGHRFSAPPSSASPRGWPARGAEATPS